jgi:hypothetical protein|tara:strand:+ start:826 stop:1263 length:438 start_codon:yes stop_codon:yes gene_type:complete
VEAIAVFAKIKKMAFKLKAFADLVGIDEELSTFDTPVFVKKLKPGVQAEANNDGSIFIDEDLPENIKKQAIDHEKVHLNQMKSGRLYYDDNIVSWKKDTKTPARVYKRIGGMLINKETGKGAPEGSMAFRWEDEAYHPNKYEQNG